jgi:O-antigen/teichoic acid export membrane protein
LLGGGLAAGCAGNLVAYWLVQREVPAQAKRDPEVLHFARHMTLYNAIPTVALHADKLLLFWLFGDEALAVYVIAVMIPEYTIAISDSTRFALLPTFTRQAESQPWLVIRRQFGLVLFIGVAAAFVCAALMPWILHFFFGGKYDQAAGLAQLASRRIPLPRRSSRTHPITGLPLIGIMAFETFVPTGRCR